MPHSDIQKLRSPSLDFMLQSMGKIYEATHGMVDEAHRHDYYTVLFIKQAKGEHLVDFNRYPFGEKQVFFVSPGQLHQVVATDKPDGWVITFSRDFLIENNIAESFILNINLFKSFTEAPPLLVDQQTFSKLQGVIDQMVICLP
ncbi:MAG: AraC family ligand binding domain-containing protein, partial [Bacteroidota bacterium]